MLGYQTYFGFTDNLKEPNKSRVEATLKLGGGLK